MRTPSDGPSPNGNGIPVDPSPRSRISFGCNLAEQGLFLESIHEFDRMLNVDRISHDPSLLAEIVYHVARIQNQLEDDEAIGLPRLSSHEYWGDDEGACGGDDFDGGWTYFETATEFADVVRQLASDSGDLSDDDCHVVLAGLDDELLEELGGVLLTLRRNRASCQRRRMGLSLLKLALFCGRQRWCGIEALCVRRAIRCFEQAATEVRSFRLRFVGERAVSAN